MGTDANGDGASVAWAVNDHDVIVDSSEKYTADHADVHPVAVMWDANGKATDLNTLVTLPVDRYLQAATSVSLTGWISGVSVTPDGQTFFSMLVPQAGTYGQGDANFDAQINFGDLVILAQHYNQSNTAQATNVGDFNLDGITNFADLVILAQHYGTSIAGLDGVGNDYFRSDWALVHSLVPEPTSLLIVSWLWTLALPVRYALSGSSHK